MPIQKRMVVYAKDVMTILGISERSAYRVLARVRKLHNKNIFAFVTVEEFCAFTGLKTELVMENLN
jgi:hypothetical protein